jgi:hypothetical protein
MWAEKLNENKRDDVLIKANGFASGVDAWGIENRGWKI